MAMNGHRRLMAIVLLGFLAPLAPAKAASEIDRFRSLAIDAPPAARSSAPARQLLPAELVAELRKGGYVLFFRHAATHHDQDDDRARSLTDCANQRGLSAKGRAEAAAIGRAFADLNIPVGQALTSPMCRADETSRLIFGKGEHTNALIGDPDFSPTDPRRYNALQALFVTPLRVGENLGLSSHGNPFRAVAGLPNIGEGEMAMIRPRVTDFEIVARVRPDAWPAIVSAARKAQ